MIARKLHAKLGVAMKKKEMAGNAEVMVNVPGVGMVPVVATEVDDSGDIITLQLDPKYFADSLPEEINVTE